MTNKATSLEVRHTQPGDIVWVRLSDDCTEEDASLFADMMGDNLPDSVSLIVTTDDLIKFVDVLSIEGLITLREQIDTALALKAETDLC